MKPTDRGVRFTLAAAVLAFVLANVNRGPVGVVIAVLFCLSACLAIWEVREQSGERKG